MDESLPAGTDPENTLIVETTPGRVIIKLRNDVAPRHAERLKLLAREGFYDDVPFHRVIDGFMAQTGDGENGNGTGGSEHPDLTAEFSKVPFKRGTVGMARTSNPNSANSQFFIMFDEGSFLNGQYTVVGEVVAGMEWSTSSSAVSRRPNPTASSRCRWRPTWRRSDLCARPACAIGLSAARSAVAGTACDGASVAAESCAAGAGAMQRAERTSLSSVVLRRVSPRPVLSRYPAADSARTLRLDHRLDRRQRPGKQTGQADKTAAMRPDKEGADEREAAIIRTITGSIRSAPCLPRCASAGCRRRRTRRDMAWNTPSASRSSATVR